MKIPIYVGEVEVTENKWGEVELHITKVKGPMKDLPFRGDRVAVVLEKDLENLRKE